MRDSMNSLKSKLSNFQGPNKRSRMPWGPRSREAMMMARWESRQGVEEELRLSKLNLKPVGFTRQSPAMTRVASWWAYPVLVKVKRRRMKHLPNKTRPKQEAENGNEAWISRNHKNQRQIIGEWWFIGLDDRNSKRGEWLTNLLTSQRWVHTCCVIQHVVRDKASRFHPNMINCSSHCEKLGDSQEKKNKTRRFNQPRLWIETQDQEKMENKRIQTKINSKLRARLTLTMRLSDHWQSGPSQSSFTKEARKSNTDQNSR